MCPDWESNLWPSGFQATTQSTGPHQPGLSLSFALTHSRKWNKAFVARVALALLKDSPNKRTVDTANSPSQDFHHTRWPGWTQRPCANSEAGLLERPLSLGRPLRMWPRKLRSLCWFMHWTLPTCLVLMPFRVCVVLQPYDFFFCLLSSSAMTVQGTQDGCGTVLYYFYLVNWESIILRLCFFIVYFTFCFTPI